MPSFRIGCLSCAIAAINLATIASLAISVRGPHERRDDPLGLGGELGAAGEFGGVDPRDEEGAGTGQDGGPIDWIDRWVCNRAVDIEVDGHLASQGC